MILHGKNMQSTYFEKHLQRKFIGVWIPSIGAIFHAIYSEELGLKTHEERVSQMRVYLIRAIMELHDIDLKIKYWYAENESEAKERYSEASLFDMMGFAENPERLPAFVNTHLAERKLLELDRDYLKIYTERLTVIIEQFAKSPPPIRKGQQQKNDSQGNFVKQRFEQIKLAKALYFSKAEYLTNPELKKHGGKKYANWLIEHCDIQMRTGETPTLEQFGQAITNTKNNPPNNGDRKKVHSEIAFIDQLNSPDFLEEPKN